MKSVIRHLSGFTLIELLVTVSIFVFMTALIVSRYGAFNQGTLMTNLAYDLALTIRTAQSFGVSVKGIEDSSSDAGAGFNQTFSGAYGVHFDTATPASFFTFIDAPSNNGTPDGVYSLAVDGPAYSTYAIKQGAKILSLCAGTGGGCTVNASSVDISFRRPDPSAIICATSGGVVACGNGSNPYTYVQIVITSNDGSSNREIIVRGNGQISVLQ